MVQKFILDKDKIARFVDYLCKIKIINYLSR